MVGSGFRRWFWRIVKGFRRSKPARKFYVISWANFAVCILSILLRPGLPPLYKDLYLVPMGLSFAFAASGISVELCSTISRLWGTKIRKAGLALFSAPILLVSDWFSRQTICQMVGENPEAFSAAKTILVCLFTPFLWVTAAMCAAGIAALVFEVIAAAGSALWLFRDPVQWIVDARPVRILFGYRRYSLPKYRLNHVLFMLSRFLGSAAWMLFIGAGFDALFRMRSYPAEQAIQHLVVSTGFYTTRVGQYVILKPGSAIAFLPGDRVCVAEPLPDGRFNFRTLQRNDLK